MKIAFVLGHNKNSKGALSEYFGMREWDFYKKVVECLDDVDVFYHNEKIRGYTSRIKNTAKKINKYPFDLVIELHFNSAVHHSANGCETLYYYRGTKSRDFAKLFSKVVTNQTGIKSRNNGLKALTNRTDRGFASVYYTKAPTILIEPFFGSNDKDCEKIKSPENMAIILKDYISLLSNGL